jgi:hypothetical protein
MTNLYSLLVTTEKPSPRLLQDTSDGNANIDTSIGIQNYAHIIQEHHELLNNIIKKIDPTKIKIFGSTQFNTQIILSNLNSINEASDIAKSHNLTIIEYDTCVQKLKDFHKINDDIMIVKSEEKVYIDSGLINNLNVSYYNQFTRAKLNNTICDISMGKISIPINMPALEKEKYERYNSIGIDIYNPNQPAFRTKCYAFTDPDTGYDTTLSYRLSNLLKNRTECTDNGCVYAGFTTKDGSVSCDCGKIIEPLSFIDERSSLLTCTGQVRVYKYLIIAWV